MNTLRKWWRKFLLFVFHKEAPPPTPDVVPLLAMDIIPPPTLTPDEQAISDRLDKIEEKLEKHSRATRRKLDHERRKLERARKKHDQFVKPQGPQPIKHERDPSDLPKTKQKTEKIEPGESIDDPNDILIADEWLKGDGEDVLFEESEFYGEFNFRDTILEQLDRYWVYLERMRKYDPDAYGFYKQVGASLMPYAATHTWSNKPEVPGKIKDLKAYKKEIVLPSWFKEHWPSFGCCAYGTNPRDEARELVKIKSGYVATPKFIYFRRVESLPWTVQPVRSGKLYILTVWWDRVTDIGRHHRYKWGRPQEFPFQISDDGKHVRVLKTRCDDDDETRPWWDWRIPHSYTDWSRQYGLDAQTHLSHLFCTTIRDIEGTSYSMLRIEVSNNDLTAVFGLSPRRTAYFFQDRDIILNEKGRKRRVFHMVRPFVDKNGRAHPTSFRGLREFTWAGYRVLITVPGRDHFLPQEFNVPVIWDVGKKRKDIVREPELGTRLKENMHRGLGRS